MRIDIAGLRVGHWTDSVGKTGCTVVVLPSGSTASGEIRGGSPATREFALLDPSRRVSNVDAVVLSGGSAFGLAAADGVMGWLEECGRGYPTAAGPVPIVVGLSLFDLGVGDPKARPTRESGYSAAMASVESPAEFDLGLIGVGVGATIAKWGGPASIRPGGLVGATIRSGEVIVSAIIAVNAFGYLEGEQTSQGIGSPAFTKMAKAVESAFETNVSSERTSHYDPQGSNTTIGVIVTNAKVDKMGCFLLSQSAHDGLARSLFPAHSDADGDAFVVASTGELEAEWYHLRVLVQEVVVQAIASLTRTD